ncbi:hypothetical protein KR200_002961 [Drosophila serrata]|nr:hypothetical protein KR200_002961 [Drosophila serrata]
MRLKVLGHSLIAMSCGSLVTYLAIHLLEGEMATLQDRDEALSLVSNGSWLHHWDRRKPTLEQLDSSFKKNEPSALRHIILVRHGEYFKTVHGSHLTERGRLQAQRTGKRLREMGMSWDQIVTSTMTRAEETATIILKELDIDTNKMKHDSLLREGIPYPADTLYSNGHRENLAYQRDGPRIDAAFQQYFFRATPEQKHDSYLLIVGHSNVIRYLILRALQLPPVAWKRLHLNHSSITWLTVHPTGYVTLRCLGDTGFIPVAQVTNRRPKKLDNSN